MNESLDQHAGHSPGPSTGSRQVAQSSGSARERAAQRAAQSRKPPHRQIAGFHLPMHAGTVARRRTNLNHSRGDKERGNKHIVPRTRQCLRTR
jgi:hypothetical protein